ncbi:MAG TPA: peptidylprolyl isomerase [Cellvibrionaceae bacterium]|nr:peptidylprolyl isomerase [Cellvibrionaceae bacterium]
MTTSLPIQAGMQVTLFFALRLPDGEVIDSNFDQQPATFVMGDGNLLPGFERVLMGLHSGERKDFVIAPEHAFGQRNPNNLQKIERRLFSTELNLEPGLVVNFADAQNTELPGVVADVDDRLVTVDFNHPLAGQAIEFDVHILNVQPATSH